MTLNLPEVAQRVYEANRDAGIESVYVGPWKDLPLWTQRVYCMVAGDILSNLNIDYVANEAPNADHS